MTHREWLRARRPTPPDALFACIDETLAADDRWDHLARTEAFVEASAHLLQRVLLGSAAARTSALALLAADACITYAFEAAADEPLLVAARAERANRRIMEVVGS